MIERDVRREWRTAIIAARMAELLDLIIEHQDRRYEEGECSRIAVRKSSYHVDRNTPRTSDEWLAAAHRYGLALKVLEWARVEEPPGPPWLLGKSQLEYSRQRCVEAAGEARARQVGYQREAAARHCVIVALQAEYTGLAKQLEGWAV